MPYCARFVLNKHAHGLVRILSYRRNIPLITGNILAKFVGSDAVNSMPGRSKTT
jgi:hypothetical protein